MLSRPFLTALDDRARVKGSVDPLGLQPIWTRLGRRVVKNLTTVTTSVREFTILLIGLFLAGQLADSENVGDAHSIEVFLKFEQLAAYSRYVHNRSSVNNEGLRGIQRVSSRLDESPRVRISAGADGQILFDQKTYGIWGLYTVSAQNSGWIVPGTHRLTSRAADFVDAAYLHLLRPVTARMLTFLKQNKVFEPRDKDIDLSRALAAALYPKLAPVESKVYKEDLLAAGSMESPQYLLWQQIKGLGHRGPFGMAELEELLKRFRSRQPEVEALKDRLEQIRTAETVLAPAESAFGFLLAHNRQAPSVVAQAMRRAWGRRLGHLSPEAFKQVVSSLDKVEQVKHAERLCGIAQALSQGDYLDALSLLLEQNKMVMQDRGSSAWVTVQGTVLNVRYGDAPSRSLPLAGELQNLWRNTYFLNTLKQIGYQIEA